MGEVKHTSGPWEVVPLSGRDGPFAIRMAAPAGNPTYYGVREIGTEANARLIAAAPDMLAALQMAMPALEWCQKQWASSPQQGSGINVLDVVRAAIAAAEGR